MSWFLLGFLECFAVDLASTSKPVGLPTRFFSYFAPLAFLAVEGLTPPFLTGAFGLTLSFVFLSRYVSALRLFWL